MPNDQTKLWYLSRINLFNTLPKNTLEEIAQTSRMRSFQKDFYISTPHDQEDTHIYFLKEGEVQVYESAANGKKIIIDILKPGDVFGYDSIATESQGTHKQFIKANKNVTVCLMPRSDFLALLEKKPELALKIIKDLSTRLSSTESRLRDTAFSNPETRVLHELKRLYGQYGEEKNGQRKITRKFTHEELANLVGTTRETITRTFSLLTNKKKISIDKSGYIILQKETE